METGEKGKKKKIPKTYLVMGKQYLASQVLFPQA
jgi:hypothetical protein